MDFDTQSPDSIHSSLCSYIVEQTKNGNKAWNQYANIFLSKYIQDDIELKLNELKSDTSTALVIPNNNKRQRLNNDSITITIFCMDGVTFPIELEFKSTVSTLKTKISSTRNI